jgi:hypothetical protein
MMSSIGLKLGKYDFLDKITICTQFQRDRWILPDRVPWAFRGTHFWGSFNPAETCYMLFCMPNKHMQPVSARSVILPDRVPWAFRGTHFWGSLVRAETCHI